MMAFGVISMSFGDLSVVAVGVEVLHPMVLRACVLFGNKVTCFESVYKTFEKFVEIVMGTARRVVADSPGDPDLPPSLRGPFHGFHRMIATSAVTLRAAGSGQRAPPLV
jgi:hypothetical protein